MLCCDVSVSLQFPCFVSPEATAAGKLLLPPSALQACIDRKVAFPLTFQIDSVSQTTATDTHMDTTENITSTTATPSTLRLTDKKTHSRIITHDTTRTPAAVSAVRSACLTTRFFCLVARHMMLIPTCLSLSFFLGVRHVSCVSRQTCSLFTFLCTRLCVSHCVSTQPAS